MHGEQQGANGGQPTKDCGIEDQVQQLQGMTQHSTAWQGTAQHSKGLAQLDTVEHSTCGDGGR